jgi:hypothetical protein
MRTLRFAFFAPLLAVAACQSDSLVAPQASAFSDRPGMVIENSSAVLAARVHDAGGAPVGIVSTNPYVMSIAGDSVELPFTLQVNIDAPQVDGLTLPASHIVFRGTRAYVSYAPAGETLVAAVDVFDISTPWRPTLISSARFADSKVTTMAVDEDRLYLGTVTADAEFADAPAVLEAVRLDDKGRLTEKSMRVSVPSHVITGIAIAEDRVWVSSGTSEKQPGGLTVLDEDDFEVEMSETIADVRAVSVNGSVVTVLVGSGARMRLYDAGSARFINEFGIGGLSTMGHKATIANVANWAFVAAGDSGVVFTRIRQNGRVTGTKLLSWGSPVGVAGVADEDAVTNAVAVSGAYAYAANGGAGVWVARGNWSSTAQNLLPTITPIGRLDLPGVSSNMVGVYGGSLFVAAGMGGLKVLQQPTP